MSLNDQVTEDSPQTPTCRAGRGHRGERYTDDTAGPVHLVGEYLASWRVRNVKRHGVRFDQGDL
jgi:hypothetical protein